MKKNKLERANLWPISNIQHNLKVLKRHHNSIIRELSLVALMLILPFGLSAQGGFTECTPDLEGTDLPDAVTVSTTAKPGVDSYFTITIDGLSSIAGQGIPAWCADQDLTLESGETHIFDVYSTYPYEALPSGAFEKPENFDSVNWLLNQTIIGEQSETPGFGEYSFRHIQYAIWLLIDDSVCVQCTYLAGPMGQWMQSDPNDVAKSEELAQLAITNGDGFKPECGELMAITLVPDNRQSLIITREVPPSECVTECVIVTTDEAKIHKDNTVSGGDVCIVDPSDEVIPDFFYNTISDGDSPDLKVEEEDGCVTTDVEVFDKVEVKEGGCLIFSGKNIFIKELKVEKHTTIKFEDCTNLFIDHDLKLEDFTTFNPDMYNVTLYVDGNVEVKKGSDISAHIYALGHDIKAEGKENDPTTMKGVFVGKKVEGKYFVNWIGNAYCDPCPPEFPEPEADCECEGGIVSITFALNGIDINDLSVDGDDDAYFVDSGNGTVTLLTTGDKLSNPDIIVNGVNTGEAHTSCSQNLLGRMFGDLMVVSYIDKEGGVISIDTCPVECECDGGIVSITFALNGVDFNELSASDGTFTLNPDGTATLATSDGDKLSDPDIIVGGVDTGDIHTSCSENILGYVYGDITVVEFTDKEGNITSQDGCGQAPPAPDCECDGGIISVTFSYDGDVNNLSSDDDNAAFTDNNDGTVTLATFDGSKLSNPDIFENGNNEGELHASCSENILGYVYGGLTVVEYIDAEGGVISIESCPADPVECACDGGLTSITLAYPGTGMLSTNSGSITDNGNGTFTISTSDKLEKDLEISVDGTVEAIVHTSCSDDILGNEFASKSTFGDSGAFPDPVDGDNNGTFLVISHTDSNGNICSIDYPTSFIAMARGGAIDVESGENQFEITEFSLKAWPNPSDNQFNIKVLSPNLTDKVNIEVFDMRSRLIHKEQFNGNTDYNFGDNFNAGLYFVRIQQGESVETIKLIKR